MNIMVKKGKSPLKGLSKEAMEKLLCDKSAYLSKRGYAIKKESFDSAYLDNLRKELTVIPFTTEDFGGPPKSFPVYLESPKKLFIPKHYAIKNLGIPAEITHKEPTKINIEFNGSIRENQMEPVQKFLDSCNLEGNYTPQSLQEYSYGGIISLPCGWGKTVIGLYITAKLGVKTLIIVHKEFLVNQWKERIEQFLPNAKVGTIQQNKMDVIGKDIVIGMLQSICMKDYPEWVFADFGFTIVDECHHISSEVFSRALPKINSRYMFGLSATPKRKDRLEKVMEWYMGPYLFVVNQRNERKVRVNMVYYNNSNPLYSGIETLPNGKPCLARMTNNITEFDRRNQLIMEIFRRSVVEDISHVLALSDRREHLRWLHDEIDKRELCSKGYYVGGMKQHDLKESESKKIMLSTFTMSSEALDVSSLNTLVLMTSHSGGSVHTQSCGRILRKAHGDFVPTIWDVVDNFSIYGNQAKKRLDYYKKQNYEIYEVHISDEESIPVDKMISELDNMKEVVVKTRRLPKAGTKVSIPNKTDNECLLDDEY